jgi:hypothetical protein
MTMIRATMNQNKAACFAARGDPNLNPNIFTDNKFLVKQYINQID